MELWMLGGDRRSPWTAQTLRAAGHAVHTFCVPSLPDETPPPEIERLILPMPCLRNGAIPGTRPLAPQEVLAHLRAGSRYSAGCWIGSVCRRGSGRRALRLRSR